MIDTMMHGRAHNAGIQDAVPSDLEQPWAQGNQEWWDWYVSLAENDTTASRRLRSPAPLPSAAGLISDELDRALSQPYRLTPAHIEFFRREGFVKLRDVFTRDALLHLRKELVGLLSDAVGAPLDGGVRDRFLSLDMVWLENELVRRFVLSPRIGKLAANLLGVPQVRLYHDNVLSKEPSCGRTPWHYDDHHFPLATHDVVSVWIPVQPIPLDMGPLAFATPIDAYRHVESIAFNQHDTSYDQHVSEAFRNASVRVAEEAFEWGDVSFHHNQSFHTAGPNRTLRSRIVLSNTYFADGARLVEQPTMVSGDWEKFAPGVAPGERLATPVNPICWPPQGASGID